MLRKVALIGRTNVGKSTLFNAILNKRIGIVEDSPHITRDFIEEEAEWEDIRFILQDTGGWDFSPMTEIQEKASSVSTKVLEESDLVVLVVDGQIGISMDDLQVARLIQRNKKNAILVVNKIDAPDQKKISHDFYQLGIKEFVFCSAIHKRGLDDLLDKIIEKLSLSPMQQKQERPVIKVALCGVPNVGKSSLTNAILGKERAIVHDMPGTTRDSLDSKFSFNKKEMLLIDTAGIRRKTKISDSVEFYSVNRAKKAIDRADVTVMLIDATKPISHHEQTLAGYLRDNHKCLVIALNKWDLVKNPDKKLEEIKRDFDRKLKFYKFVPFVTVSALNSLRVTRLLENVLKVYEAKNTFLDPSELKLELERALFVQNFTVGKKQLMIKSVKQVKGDSPTFRIKTNIRDYREIPEHIRRFFERMIRELLVWLDKVFGMNRTKKLMIRPRKYGGKKK
jgi:GTP-binding protein